MIYVMICSWTIDFQNIPFIDDKHDDLPMNDCGFA